MEQQRAAQPGGRLAFDADFVVAEASHEGEELAVLKFLAGVVGDAFEEAACGLGHFVVVVFWLGLLLLFFFGFWLECLRWCETSGVACSFEFFPYAILVDGHVCGE